MGFWLQQKLMTLNDIERQFTDLSSAFDQMAEPGAAISGGEGNMSPNIPTGGRHASFHPKFTESLWFDAHTRLVLISMSNHFYFRLHHTHLPLN